MEKKTISVHAFTVHLYTIAIVLLILLLGILGLKYLHLKLAMHSFTEAAMWQQANQAPVASVTDLGQVIATTIGQYPQDKPLLTQPLLLENYVTTVAKQLKRDIVVMDVNRKVLADSIVGNMGSKYSSDTGNEISQSIQDGKTRTFTEVSTDFPSGLSEIIVPVRDGKNTIVGVVLISNAQVGN